MATAAKKSVTLTVSDPDPKRHSVRYNEEKYGFSPYIPKDLLRALGNENAESVKITFTLT